MLHWGLALGSREAALEQGKLCRSGCELPKIRDGEAGQVLTPVNGALPAAGSQGGAGKLLELGSSGAFASPTRLHVGTAVTCGIGTSTGEKKSLLELQKLPAALLSQD